jgi:hypothetical protein
MARNLDDMIKSLPASRRRKIERRAKALISEEMTLQELRRASRDDPGSLGEKPRRRTEANFRNRKAYRHAHLDASPLN